MKKSAFFATGLIVLSGIAIAADAQPERKVKKMTREQFEARRYKSTGGLLIKPGTFQGKVVYVNAQKSAPVEWLKDNAAEFEKRAKIAVSVEEGSFVFPPKLILGNASLFVIEDESMPSLLSAPENRWVAVNVAPLKKGAGEKEAFFKARVSKELTRGFAILAGAQSSNYPGSLVGCVTKAEDLDRFADNMLPVDVFARFNEYVLGYGIIPKKEVAYRMACQEGWAPAPTNDIQKAFWDKAHQIPTKPIKIEFDPKTDKK